MKVHFWDNDPAQFTRLNYEYNRGSFATVSAGLNKELKIRGLYAELNDADIIGFPTGIGLEEFRAAFPNKKKAILGVWESSELPQYIIDFRRQNESEDFKFLAFSKQYQEICKKAGFANTPIVDAGVDLDFWKRSTPHKKIDKFKILSLTSCNFRSSIDQLIVAFINLDKDKYSLTIKDTDERNGKLPIICNTS